MFTRRYVFETKATKLKRTILNGTLVFILILFSFSCLCIYLPIQAKKQNDLSKSAFYISPPDLIVVFTGDVGRIKYALELAKKNESTKVLISGVHTANSMKTLLKSEELTEDFSKRVEIDYLPQNTIENVYYTIRYLRTNPVLKRILIISSDYHLFRIQMLLNSQSNKDNFDFYYQGSPTSFDNWRNIKILLKEGVKVIRSLAIYFT